MPNVTKKESYHYQIYHCWKVKSSSHEKLFQKKKNYCYDFQVICGSMVVKNCRSPASTESHGGRLFPCKCFKVAPGGAKLLI